MKKHYVSDYWNKGIKGHLHYKFIDVVVNDDNLLFIDPLLIEIAGDEWCQKANATIKSFFDEFYKAYREENLVKKKTLLSHAGEQNGTRLGYGRGNNGKGNTVNGLLEIFASLNKFTLKQMKKYGVESNESLPFWAWDVKDLCWKKIERPSYCVDGQELLVVPKHIVRKKYLFSTSQYFNRIILERIREEGGYMDGDKPIPKKEIVKAKRFSGDHWQYDESVSYTKKDNDALNEYHHKLPHFYAENGGPMEDEELDELIYGYLVE